MNGKRVRDYLLEICDALDGRRPVSAVTLQRILAPVAVPAALTLALGLPACADEYGAPFEDEVCDDGFDNDGDGDIDCSDEDCFDDSYCMDLYGAVFEDCSDGVDNDDDGLIDCADTDDCASHPDCAGNLYGAPWG